MPSAVAKARGYKKRKGRTIPGKEPKPEVKVPRTPKSVAVNADAKKCWSVLSKQLKKMRVLSEADTMALEGLCRAYAMAMELDREIDREGLILEDLMGKRYANPAVAMSRSSWQEVRKFAVEFGLTPSARTRVREVEDPDADASDDPQQSADNFLFGGGRVVGNIGG